jgi:predicted membrane GTPase involved in stress response
MCIYTEERHGRVNNALNNHKSKSREIIPLGLEQIRLNFGTMKLQIISFRRNFGKITVSLLRNKSLFRNFVSPLRFGEIFRFGRNPKE